MSRRTKRQETLAGHALEEYLNQLGDLRRACTSKMATIKPFGQDYVHLMKLVEVIDNHQYFWTEDRRYFYAKGSNGGTGKFDYSRKIPKFR